MKLLQPAAEKSVWMGGKCKETSYDCKVLHSTEMFGVFNSLIEDFYQGFIGR